MLKVEQLRNLAAVSRDLAATAVDKKKHLALLATAKDFEAKARRRERELPAQLAT